MNFKNSEHIYVIAEIGVNHNGSLDLAKKMIDAAKQSGANAVKFQTFKADNLVTKITPKVKYQEETTSKDEDHFEMIKKLELNKSDFLKIFNYCNKIGIDFISTPYDVESAKFLDKMGVSIFKVASADIVDYSLNEYLAATKKPVIIATGMTSLGEIESAVNIYRKNKSENICLLHCVSNYPCSYDSINIKAMATIGAAFNLPIGFSDHSIGDMAACLSVALGAKVIEKHFTIDKNLPGPDHKASASPDEFKSLVSAIKLSKQILGSSIKEIQDEEKQMALVSRKSIVAKFDLPKDYTIREKDLVLKRPGTGLSSKYLPELIGRVTSREVVKDKLISWYDLKEII